MEQIVYGQPLLPRAVSVEAMSDFMLKIRFTNNEERFFDVKKIYHLPCFAPLRNKEFFKTVPIEYGSVAWSDGIDYCPDCLYEESVQAASLLEADEYKYSIFRRAPHPHRLLQVPLLESLCSMRHAFCPSVNLT